MVEAAQRFVVLTQLGFDPADVGGGLSAAREQSG
jgi:hypothetical protein